MQTLYQMINLDPKQMTEKEKDEAITYYRTLIVGQAVHIDELEKENVTAINDAFRLARQVDMLTDGLFFLPYATTTEYVV